MSASEKLKGLKPGNTNTNIINASILVAALPQIADVVAAAEAVSGNGWIKGEDDGAPEALAVAAALTALEEALGGDVT